MDVFLIILYRGNDGLGLRGIIAQTGIVFLLFESLEISADRFGDTVEFSVTYDF